MSELSPSVVGATIQGAGLAALAALLSVVARQLRRGYLRLWALGWAALALSIAVLQLSFRIESGRWLQPIYHFGEFAFLYLLYLGCRVYAGGPAPTRREGIAAIPAAGLALVLPWAFADFTDGFMVQAAILALGFGLSFRTLLPARHARPGTGLGLTLLALALLALDFLHYVPVFALQSFGHVVLPLAYSGYTSIYDLLLEGLLALGLVALGLEDARHEVEAAHLELRQAHDRLETAFREIRTLTGLLPVCAWCRKVRDDRGYWKELEAYVTEHTSAEFTHGICPACLEKSFRDIG